MPVAALRRPQDGLKSVMSAGCTMNMNGDVILAPFNLFPEQYFQEISATGAPPFIRSLATPKEEGYFVYLSQPDGSPETLSRQNAFPIDPEDDSYEFSHPVANGAAPKRRQSGVASLLAGAIDAQSDPLYVDTDQADTSGFEAGEYFAAISYITKGNLHTELSEPVEFTVNQTGQIIEFPSLPPLPADAKAYGLWLSKPNKGAITMRLQAKVRPGRKKYTLTGPFNSTGKKVPKGNETQLDKPPRPFWGHDIKRRRDRGAHALQPMLLRVYIVFTTPEGETLPSRSSSVRVIREEQDKTVFKIRPRRFPPRATGYKVFAQVDAGRQFYQLVKLRRPNSLESFSRNKEDRVELYGYVLTGDREVTVPPPREGLDDLIKPDMSPEEKQKIRKQHEARVRRVREERRFRSIPYVLVEQEPPQENSTGIESPSGQIEPPVATGLGRPPAGKYWVTYSRLVGGKETVMANPERITIDSSEVIWVQFPSRVNRLPHARFSSLRNNGLPRGWSFDLSTGTAVAEDGVLTLSTIGTVADNGDSPRAESSKIPIASDRTETIRGELEMTQYGGEGHVALLLQQYDGDGNEIASSASTGSATVELARLEFLGATQFSKTFGSEEDNPDVVWHEDAIDYSLVALTSGNPRSMTYEIKNLASHPYNDEPRKVILSEVNSLEHDETTIDPAVPYPARSIVAYTLPPSTNADASSNPPPLDTLDFEDGGVGDWSKFLSQNNPNLTLDVIEYEGSQVLRSQSNMTGSKSSAVISKNYGSIPRESLAIRSDVNVKRTPREPGAVPFLFVRAVGEDGRAGGRIFINKNGGVAVEAVDRNGRSVELKYLLGNVKDNQWLDCEVIVGGYDTRDGTVTGKVGLLGGSREVFTITGVDLRGCNPQTPIAGGIYEDNRKTKWTFFYDNIRVTPNGDVEEAVSSPNIEPIEEPHRPTKTGSILLEDPGAVSSTVPPSGRENLGVQATFTIDGLPGAEETMIVIRTSASPGGTVTGRVGFTASGDVYMEEAIGGDTHTIAEGLQSGDEITLDLVARGAGTGGGVLSCYRNLNSEGRRLWGQITSAEWTDLNAQVGETRNDTGFTAQNTVISDVGSVVLRDTDINGDTIYQAYVFVNPLEVIDGRIGFETDEVFVKPGLPHTVAVFCEHRNAPVEDIVEAPQPFQVILYNEAGEEHVVGSVYGVEGVTVANAGWEDRYIAFTPPEGYFRLKITFSSMWGGSYVFQEPLISEGILETQEDRDVRRGFIRHSSGTIETILEANVPGKNQVMTDFLERWKRVDIDVDVIEDATSVVAEWRSTDADPPVEGSWESSWEPDPNSIPFDKAYLGVRAQLDGDGISTPTIPSGGIALEYHTFQPALLRADRSCFRGGTVIGNLTRPYSLPEYKTDPLSGRANPVATTDPVLRLDGFEVDFYDPESYIEFMQTHLEEEFFIEYPAANLLLQVRFYEVAELTPFESALLEESTGFYQMTVAVSRAEVVSSAPLVRQELEVEQTEQLA